MKPNLPEPYQTIVSSSDASHLRRGITNGSLTRYFDACFRDTLDHFEIWPCWACVGCLKQARSTIRWGEKPGTCPLCGSRSVYEIATFNARASKVGDTFGWAFLNLMWEHFRVPVFPTPRSARTHDFEVTEHVAIEAKGSPSNVRNPDGTSYHPGRPGMRRTDTERKAFRNGAMFHQANRDAYFCIATNALPTRLEAYRSQQDVNSIIVVTRVDNIEAFIRDIGSRIDLDALRQREFGTSS